MTDRISGTDRNTNKFKGIDMNLEWDYKDKSKLRYSAGIALCRYSFKKKNIELLFVKKRCTYWYTTFVLGKYNVRGNERLLYMFSRMTPEEKLVILSMNFETIWNHHWQTHNFNPKFGNRRPIIQAESYATKKAKFDELVLKDNGNRLRNIISRSKNRPLIWEIPKGRKHNNAENDIECAVREFEEETNIKKDSYMFLPMNPISYSHRDGDVNYTNLYYIATPIKPIRCRLNFDMLDQISEIIDVKWFTEQEAVLMNCAHTNFLHKLYMACKKIISPIHKLPTSEISVDQHFYEDIPLSITNDTSNE